MSRILIIDDDVPLADTLGKSFQKRGFTVRIVNSYEDAISIAQKENFDNAVVDLRLKNRSGLECVKELLEMQPELKIVVLTGYASISTAVEAIKLGACHYLAKPANSDEIIKAFEKGDGDISAPITARPSSIKNLEWETIQSTLEETNYNISETARRLGMHRRTLARKLQKQPIK
jgi:two-component system response regulator RegA